MPRSLRLPLVLIWVAVPAALSAHAASAADDHPIQQANGGETTTDRPTLLQRVAHRVMQPFQRAQPPAIRHYEQPSSFYGLWPRTEIFGHDARCQSTAFAPRGYGWPKHLAPYRADYAPYTVKHGQTMDGPAWWHVYRREPCGKCCCSRGCGCIKCCKQDHVSQP